ncbi:DNA mismatch repair [Tubulinosema ratisbonensis]|uniref:DNA mismatch repair n=1 Tax=Tubulinosema ratisbonensis TaxID=291195 RepID=A0A437AME1_9MICR|nr:DNA mismatch repair [Tubulinosema ratisbonensis]
MHKLKKETSSLIKSQHTFSNTFTILKELIENSLDAKSTKITISLTNDSITIQDNGSGISNFDLVGCEGCTSKTEELNNIFSAQPMPITSFYGFRGQALFSLSKISKLTIESNEKRKDFFTNKMVSSYLREGSIVTVSDIFYNIPVRKKLLNVKRELNQIIYLLNSYLIVNNISITLYFFDKLILSKKSPILFSKEIITEKFNICLSKEINLNNIYIFYLNKPVIDTHLKRIIHYYVKENVILIIKEKCDINTCGKNEVLIRNRDEFIKQLRNKLNELMNEECYLIPSPENKKIKNDLPFNQEKIEEAIKSIISPSLLKSLIKEIKEQPSEQIETIVKTTTQPIKITETFSKIKTLTKTKIKTQNIPNQQNQTIINTIFKYTQPKKEKCIDRPVNKKENCVTTPTKEEETSTVYVFKDDKDCVTNS